jgi:hypothetical protein
MFVRMSEHALGTNRPMHVIKIQVSDSKILEGIIDSGLDPIDVMAVIVQHVLGVIFSNGIQGSMHTGHSTACW